MAAKLSDLVRLWMQCHLTSREDLPAQASPAAKRRPSFLDQSVGVVDTTVSTATAHASVEGGSTSDWNVTGRAIYTDPKNLGTAIASIMNHVQNRAHFHPADMSADKLAQALSGYVREVDVTPFFHLLNTDEATRSCHVFEFYRLIDEVVMLHEGLATVDKEVIKTAMTNMGKSVFGLGSGQERKIFLSQTTLCLSNPEQPILVHYLTSLNSEFNMNLPPPYQEVCSCTVQRRSYVVLPYLIMAYADTLVTLEKKSADDWVKEHTSLV